MLILHLGDTHFSGRRLEEKIRCANHIVEKARELKPDFIVHAGDVFDTSIRMEDESAVAAVQFFNNLSNIAPVLVAKGNESHDKASVEILRYVNGRHPLLLCTEPQVVGVLEHGLEGMSLEEASQKDDWPYAAVCFALPYPSSSFLAKTVTLNPESLRQAVSEAITNVIRGFAAIPIPAGIPKILVFHGTVVGAQFSPTQAELGMDIDLSPHDIGECGFTMTMAAHLHHCQRIETSSGPIYYPGGLCCFTFADEPPKGAWLHTFENGLHVESEHLTVPASQMRTFELNLLESELFVVPPEWADEACDVRVIIKVRENETHLIKGFDFKALFPNAKSIVIQRIVEAVKSVRCEEVRAAKKLRDKVAAYCSHAGLVVSESLLQKADLLESFDGKEIEAIVKRGLGVSVERKAVEEENDLFETMAVG